MLTVFPLFSVLYDLYEHDCKAAGENLTNPPSLCLYYIIKHTSLLHMAAEMEQISLSLHWFESIFLLNTPRLTHFFTYLRCSFQIWLHIWTPAHLSCSHSLLIDLDKWITATFRDGLRPLSVDGFLAGKCRNVTGASRGRPEQGSLI